MVRPDQPRPTPCVPFFNGLDSTKEQIYSIGTANELRRLDRAGHPALL